jgi:signal transduction histidine kinase
MRNGTALANALGMPNHACIASGEEEMGEERCMRRRTSATRIRQRGGSTEARTSPERSVRDIVPIESVGRPAIAGTALGQHMADETERMIAELSHDLRQPLTSLHMNLQSAMKLLQQPNARVSPALEALGDCLSTEHDIVVLIESAKRRAAALTAPSGAFELNHFASDIITATFSCEPGWRSRIHERMAMPSPLVSPRVVRLRMALRNTLRQALFIDERERATWREILIETDSVDGRAELRMRGLPASLAKAWSFQALHALTTTLVSQLEGVARIEVDDAQAELIISLPRVTPITPLIEGEDHGD